MRVSERVFAAYKPLQGVCKHPVRVTSSRFASHHSVSRINTEELQRLTRLLSMLGRLLLDTGKMDKIHLYENRKNKLEFRFKHIPDKNRWFGTRRYRLNVSFTLGSSQRQNLIYSLSENPTFFQRVFFEKPLTLAFCRAIHHEQFTLRTHYINHITGNNQDQDQAFNLYDDEPLGRLFLVGSDGDLKVKGRQQFLGLTMETEKFFKDLLFRLHNVVIPVSGTVTPTASNRFFHEERCSTQS